MELFDGRYEQESLLGQGAFSKVWKVKDTQTGVTLALKVFTVDRDYDESGMNMLTREFSLMIDADHPNLLRPLYFGVSHDDSHQPYLTLPFCKSGNINKMIGQITENEAWKLIRDTASALAYLHAMNPPIIHQDIKPANILIGNDGYYKLSDFGVSIQVRSTITKMTEADKSYLSAGTISYMAPEKFSSDHRPIMANDIYSLGATVYEMLTGYLPFGNDGGLLQMKGAKIPVLQGNYSQQLKDVLKQCLDEKPWNRPLAEQLVAEAEKALQKNISYTTSQAPLSQKHNRKRIAYCAVAIIALVCIGAYSFFATDSSVPPTFVKSETAIEEAKDAITNKTPLSPEPSVSVKEEPTKEAEKPQNPIEETSNLQDTRAVTRQVKQSETEETETRTQEGQGQKDLGYAVWTGSLSNGHPEGFGIITFKQSHDLGNGKIAQKGDRITDCEFHNGRIYQGCWHKANGDTEMILP